MLHRPFALVGDTRHGRRQAGWRQVRTADSGQPVRRVRQARSSGGLRFLSGDGGVLRNDAGRRPALPGRTRAHHRRRSALIITDRIGRGKIYSFSITLFRIIDPGQERLRPGSFVFRVVTGRVALRARPEPRRSSQWGPMREQRERVVPLLTTCPPPRRARRASA